MHPSPARAVTSALGRHVTDLTRPPVTTSLVLAATAAMSVAQWLHSGLLARLERTPAELHGQPWRILTSLFVHEAATVLWCAAVLGTLPSQWYLAAVLAGVLGVRYAARLRSRGIRTSRAVAVVVVLTAAVLIVFHNIHGAALAVGLALALPGRLPATRRPHIRMDLGR
jgi:hypothetical protein